MSENTTTELCLDLIGYKVITQSAVFLYTKGQVNVECIESCTFTHIHLQKQCMWTVSLLMTVMK